MEAYDCPTCGVSFDTKRGRGVHHVHVHGERLPNRTCDYCGDSFYSDYAKRYCSYECLLESDSYAGENNPNYKGGKETAECKICGSSFEFYPSSKPGYYCGECVHDELWQTPPGLSGPDHPRWSGGKLEATCDVCGSTFRRRRSALEKGSATLCSRECHSQWLSDAFTGEGHPNWKGGGNEAYGKRWRRARRQTLARDDHTCAICGTTREALGRNPDVHHVVPVRAFIDAPVAEKTDAHVPRNLITLCVGCHRRADVGRPAKAALKRLVAAASEP
jgi:hypothetical protein